MKRMRMLAGVVLAVVVGVNSVGAQDGPRGGGRGGDGVLREIVSILAEESGLAPREIVAQLAQGVTLADIIIENGGDVQVVLDAALAAATERVNEAVASGTLSTERADQLLESLPLLLDQAMNGELGLRGERGRGPDALRGGERFLLQAVVEATGLDPQDIGQQLRDGSTLAEIITANGGDVQAVTDAAIASATERINVAVASGRITQEQADEMLASLNENITALLNGDLYSSEIESRAGRGVLNLAAEATGLSPFEIRSQLASGSTLADILTENGVDVTAFVSDATARLEARLNVQVVDGRITAERATELLADFEARLTELLNQAGGGQASI